MPTYGMGRPLYETKEHLRAEAKFRNTLEEHFRYCFKKLPIVYRADYAMTDANVVKGWIELKNRSIASDKYETAILSLQKFLSLKTILKESNLPVWLAYRFTDNDYLLPITDKPNTYEIIWFERNIKRDWQDNFPMVHVKIEEMTCL